MSPLDEAQQVMYQAWEAPTRQHAETLDKKALTLSADCADAYTLLARETAKSLEEAIDLYTEGVKAGERAIGKKAFEDDVGHFWGSRALLDFRKFGDCQKADASLKKALSESKHVPICLLERKKVPRTLPSHYGFGDVNEAMIYVHGNKAAWQATQGAIEWLSAKAK